VRDPVPTGSGMNHFTIDSDFGVFEADGNEMLLQRLKEIDAIARLQDVSRTDEFKKSLVAAAKSPLNSAKNIARDPAQAISNVPKGIMKFLGRAKETVENVGKDGGGEARRRRLAAADDSLMAPVTWLACDALIISVPPANPPRDSTCQRPPQR